MPDQAFAITCEVNRPLDVRIAQERERHGLLHSAFASWPCDPQLDVREADWPLLTSYHGDGDIHAVYRDPPGEVPPAIIYLVAQSGALAVNVYSHDPATLTALMERVKARYPEHRPEDPEVIPITFWSFGPHGPQQQRRMLDGDAWKAINVNYPPHQTRPPLDLMMSDEFKPGLGGQLLLWHGPPGTGKTTALRSLAREWREWCDIHYIVDPDKFFGDEAAYMMTVLLGGLYDDEEEESPRWRLLVLEDCGEMLQPDARREVGQALSRLLNACDGLIGRGLRIMLLITTNEPVEKLHEAVARPGRCAMNIEFTRFSRYEAETWLKAHGGEPPSGPGLGTATLADLYAQISDFQTREPERPLGFR